MSKKKSEGTAKTPSKTTKTRAKKTSKGLGDDIEKITEATGIKKAVEWFTDLTGIDCGCEERKEKLNELFPRKKISCMNKTQYDQWTAYREKNLSMLTKEDLDFVAHLHSNLFNHPYHRPCTCAPKRWKDLIQDINKLYETYED